MIRHMRTTLACLTVIVGLLHTSSVLADSCSDEADGSEKKQGKFHIEYVNGKPVTVIDTVVAVCGKVPRPSVIVLTTAKNLEYEWESLKQDFMPLIVASVKKAPF